MNFAAAYLLGGSVACALASVMLHAKQLGPKGLAIAAVLMLLQAVCHLIWSRK